MTFRRFFAAASIAALAFLVVPDAPGRSTSVAPAPKLQRLVRGLVADGAPGSLAVVRTPTRVVRASSGFSDRELRVRMQPTDRFRIASLTKTFVATVVLQLVAEGRLTLDDAVERWVPSLIPNGSAITVRELLNHTSGLFDYIKDPAFVAAVISNPGREWSPRELVAVATAHPLLFAPGSGYAYSNTNYIVVGMIVESVTGEPIDGLLRRRIFQPLGLRSTSFASDAAVPGRLAHGYVVSAPPLPFPAGTLVDMTTMLSPTIAWAAAQIISNADDVTTLLSALLGGRLLPRAQLAQMKRTRGANYGLGLRVTRTACGVAYGNSGDYPGYRNVVWATASGRRVANVMVNIDESRVSWTELDTAAQVALCWS
jgi:D-alanyl-D-alanine carboxypeptidase